MFRTKRGVYRFPLYYFCSFLIGVETLHTQKMRRRNSDRKTKSKSFWNLHLQIITHHSLKQGCTENTLKQVRFYARVLFQVVTQKTKQKKFFYNEGNSVVNLMRVGTVHNNFVYNHLVLCTQQEIKSAQATTWNKGR